MSDLGIALASLRTADGAAQRFFNSESLTGDDEAKLAEMSSDRTAPHREVVTALVAELSDDQREALRRLLGWHVSTELLQAALDSN